jgi:hypothetical protein
MKVVQYSRCFCRPITDNWRCIWLQLIYSAPYTHLYFPIIIWEHNIFFYNVFWTGVWNEALSSCDGGLSFETGVNHCRFFCMSCLSLTVNKSKCDWGIPDRRRDSEFALSCRCPPQATLSQLSLEVNGLGLPQSCSIIRRGFQKAHTTGCILKKITFELPVVL